jgi:hypothetical protein
MKHKHHVHPKHLGGSDDRSNLVEIDFIEHARIHAERFLASEDKGFDNRHAGWPYLEEDLRIRVLRKQGEKTRSMNLKKAEEGTHPFQSEKFRKENSKRTRERNLKLAEVGMLPAQIASREGTHPWQTEEHREKSRVKMTLLNEARIEKGEPFYSQTPGGKEAIGKRQSQLIKEGKHFFGSDEHRKQAKERAIERNKSNKGAKHWVNSKGERKFQKESPGPGWQNGQKWKG